MSDGSVVVQSLSRVQLFAPPLTAARQASLSFTVSQSLLKLTSIESVMLSNHLVKPPPSCICAARRQSPPLTSEKKPHFVFVSSQNNNNKNHFLSPCYV